MEEYGLSGGWYGVTYDGDIWFNISREEIESFDVELDCVLEDLNVTTSFTDGDYFEAQRDWIINTLQ